MQTSTPEQEKLLKQMAIRRVSRGKGSAFFNLLFPFSLIVSFGALYGIPALLTHLIIEAPGWLGSYLKWSPALIIIAALSLYGVIRQHRLKPVIAMLRIEMSNSHGIK